ncbi:Ubiquitin-like protein 3 [Orchesella cincta]|uniref:Ubiquitin-like protein 3 n=1 Tax=Orchesella cincta TaxID=48709 RepID=A0A1D2MGB2_ORCCI|nr:Ubiquitin-like protein 3 [Orchesella cincta]
MNEASQLSLNHKYCVGKWVEEAVSKAEILRLIYQGRFLHSNVTLGALGLPLGKTTVMHLVPRENLPEPNSQGTFLTPPSNGKNLAKEKKFTEVKSKSSLLMALASVTVCPSRTD